MGNSYQNCGEGRHAISSWWGMLLNTLQGPRAAPTIKSYLVLKVGSGQPPCLDRQPLRPGHGPYLCVVDTTYNFQDST